LLGAEQSGDFAQGEFRDTGLLGGKEVAHVLEEDGALADALLEPVGVDGVSGLLGDVGGFESDAVEPIADLVGEDVEELLKFFARDEGGIGRRRTHGGPGESVAGGLRAEHVILLNGILLPRRGPARYVSAMILPVRSREAQGPWVSLWIVALLSLLGQLWICQFFSFGERVPISIDVDPSNLWKYAYQFPPSGEFLVLNWLGLPNLPPSLSPFSLAAAVESAWLFFTTYTPVLATLALLAMAAFLRELELPRPAALFGGIIFAWQGDILPFIFPGHFAYIATWPFYALGAWGALSAGRTGHAAYALISGACCGIMVGMQPDRAGIASLLIAALFLASAWRERKAWRVHLGHLFLCTATAILISLAACLALFQSNIEGVSMGGQTSREQTFQFDTQFSYGPEDTLTYLVPGFFGWHSNSSEGPYWGRIGEDTSWPKTHEGMRNFNLAISTAGSLAATLALLAALLLLPGVGRWIEPESATDRQRSYGRVLLGLGLVALILAWGYHTPFYRLLFALPLMDKWRDPLKWLEMTNFALVTLSALGVQTLLRTLSTDGSEETRSLRLRVRWFLDGMITLLLLGLGASYPFTTHLAAVLQAESYEPGVIANIMSTLHFSVMVAVGVVALGDVLLRLLWNPERLRGWRLENPWLHRLWHGMVSAEHLPLTLALGLAAISVGQLAWVAMQFVTPTELSFLTATNPLVEQLKNQGPTVRVSVAAQDPVLNVLLQNQFNTPRISCLDISAASRIPNALSTFFGDLQNDPLRLWFLAGVKNRVIPQAQFVELRQDPRITANIDHVDGYMLQATDSPNLPSHALVQFRDYLQKATFVPGAEILPTAEAQLERLKDPNWNPRATVLLDQAPRVLAIGSGNAPAAAQVDLKTYTPHRIEIHAQASQEGFLLINDAYDPDWEVEVNGQAAPLLKADYMLRAVAIPAGSTTVKMRYVAHYRVGGWSLRAETVNLFSDAVMLAAWLIAGVALGRRGRALNIPSSALHRP
jgi:hypothetical protein